MYMPEIGMWSCIDPKSEKYLDYGPYHYVKNNPVKYIDINGMENSIYLYVHTNEDGERAISNKEARKIKREANRYFRQNNLDTRVRIVKDIPDARDLDSSDSFAFVGKREDARKFNNENTGFDKVPDFHLDSGAPEVSSNVDDSKASIIFLKPDDISASFKQEKDWFIENTTLEQYTGGLASHGSGHNATLNHSYSGFAGSNDVNPSRGTYGLGDDRMVSFMGTPYLNKTAGTFTFNQLMSNVTTEQREIYIQKFHGRSRNTLNRNRRMRSKE